MQDEIAVRRALISVSDKTGLVEFGRVLADCGGELLSTGGTAKALQAAGIEVRDVADYTGFPEMMGGRVKTLHPKIHGGLLALREEPDHRQAMQAHDIGAIDLIVVNLYPFEQTVAAGAGPDEIIENIDIGGPAMIRSAAKNHQYVTVVVDPADYPRIIEELRERGGKISLALRRELAAKAFARTAQYDSAIGRWFEAQQETSGPQPLLVTASAPVPLRYGENPHQRAAFYADPLDKRLGAARARQLHGKPLSYNNLNDADAAFELVSEIGQAGPAVAIIKHANPCGAALGDNLAEAYRMALRCDSVSAFGGVVAVNQTLDAETASLIAEIFTEVVIAPQIDAEALEILTAKKNLRLLETGALADPAGAGRMIRTLAGGYLVQDRDNGCVSAEELKTVTRRAPSENELQDLLFAFRVAKHVKSNAIVYAKDGATVGIGAGQMSRVDSARIAAEKALDASKAAGLDEGMTNGSVVASDAFFPFADGLLAAVEAGAKAVIQPGGSIRDDEVIAAADDAGIAMVFTGMRHFRH